MGKGLGNVPNRRQLLAGVLRYATLGLLMGVAGYICAKRRRLLESDKCVNFGLCRRCGVFGRCNLPLALQARKDLMGADNG